MVEVPTASRPPGAAFVADTHARLIHRVATAHASCGIAEIPREGRVDIPDVLKASMMLKTRHYMPCPRCWQGSS